MLKIADKLAGCLASLASTINLQSIGLPVFPTGAIVVICLIAETDMHAAQIVVICIISLLNYFPVCIY